jgi:hypothetical protein
VQTSYRNIERVLFVEDGYDNVYVGAQSHKRAADGAQKPLRPVRLVVRGIAQRAHV